MYNINSIIEKQTALTIANSNANVANIICRNIGDAAISVPQSAATKCCTGLSPMITNDLKYPEDIKLYTCS